MPWNASSVKTTRRTKRPTRIPLLNATPMMIHATNYCHFDFCLRKFLRGFV